MRPSPLRDLVVGLFVLVGLGAVAYLSIEVGGLGYRGPGGLVLYADFDQIGGLKTRAPVMIAGVKVGQVGGITLDDSMRAHVKLEIDRKLKLPTDTSAAIQTAGLLGDQFIALEPGADEKFLTSGTTIAFTTNALSIESLISKFVASSDSGEGEKKKK
ncbi:MAG TPA: outer membrane lipid asymmetry maintenance protein MlaD [Deltaproteobacteria bacterium]|jgi:phospholipid/cholesterol/gamma-HCH transport system substrate-binding protein|nr:outer membrane lipid asymmetry maintenance protein MlaD [Deltaproteobacteria bacterium]